MLYSNFLDSLRKLLDNAICPMLRNNKNKLIILIALPVVALIASISLNLRLIHLEANDRPAILCSHDKTVTVSDPAMIAAIVSDALAKRELPKETAFRILNSTVKVDVGNSNGTGVIIFGEKHGNTVYNYIITNKHVVKDAERVVIKKTNYLNGREVGETASYSGTVLASCENRDLALIEVRAPRAIGNVAGFITIADYKKISLYDPIFICGCPLGNRPAITNGNISSITETSHIVTAFAIFGNSGGGVFTSEGKIFGIVNRISGVSVPGSKFIPEPNMTNVISTFVVTSWLVEEGYSFILGENYGSFEGFLEERDAEDNKKYY